MDGFFILATSDLLEKARDTGVTFGVNWHDFLAQMVSFTLVMLVLARFVYPPVVKALAERRKLIADGLAGAEKIQAEVERTRVERQEILHKANVDAAHMLEEARNAAARVKDEELHKAKVAAEQILAHAREAVAREKVMAKEELRKEVGRLVVSTAAQVTGKVLTAADQERLLTETAKELVA